MRAIGLGDAAPAEASLRVTGAAMHCPAPVHGRVEVSDDGALTLRWVRCSRNGWIWVGSADVPIGEEKELYRLSIFAGESELRSVTLSDPDWTYAAADRAFDLSSAGGGVLHARITQLGTWGEGRALFVPLS